MLLAVRFWFTLHLHVRVSFIKLKKIRPGSYHFSKAFLKPILVGLSKQKKQKKLIMLEQLMQFYLGFGDVTRNKVTNFLLLH